MLLLAMKVRAPPLPIKITPSLNKYVIELTQQVMHLGISSYRKSSNCLFLANIRV